MVNENTAAAALRGSIRVQVLQAKRLPSMDFGRAQNPFVCVQLESSEGLQPPCRSDTIFKGGQNPVWTNEHNRDLDIYWSGVSDDDATLRVEVWNDSKHEKDLIGVGFLNVQRIVSKQIETPVQYTVSLKESESGSQQRGEVQLNVSFGPPLRAALRAAQKATRVLEFRDSFIGSLCLTAESAVSKVVPSVKRLVKNNKKVAAVAGTGLVGGSVGALALAVIIAVPMGFFALISIPLWIIPAMIASVATAPIWVPLLAMVAMFGFTVIVCFTSFALTSQPIRKRGAKMASNMMETKLGKKLAYEKVASSSEEESKH